MTARTGFYACLALLLGSALPGRSALPPPATLDGLWKGPLQMPGGQLEVVFRIIKLTNGDYFATLSVPLQKVSNLAVSVVMHADTLILTSEEAHTRYVGVLAADGGQVAGTWQQPGYQAPLVLAHSLPPTEVANPRLTPPYRAEELTFANSEAGLNLAGTLTVPAGPGPFPAVVLLSDSGPQNRNGKVGDFAPLGILADYLTRRGVAVLRFDDRGTGQSTGSAQTTVAERVSDAQAALSFLRTQSQIDLQHLGLLGHGEGANVAFLAATLPLPPAFIVGLAPYGLPGSDVALQQQEATLRNLQTDSEQLKAALKRQALMFDIIRQTLNNIQAQDIVTNMLLQNNAGLDPTTAQASAAEMVSPSYRYFLAFNPVEKLAEVACPTLLLFGTADNILNVDNNLNALTKGLKANKELTTRKLPGVNHLFQPDPAQWPIIDGEAHPSFSPVAQETIRAWITEQVKK